MELTKIIIVSLSIAAASSTPHGYGVKGGASATSGAVAGAVAFPGVLPDFGGTGGGSFSSSGSFSKASSSSFASSSAGAFSYSGSGGYGGSAPGAGSAQGQYGDGNGAGGGGAGAAANANAAAFAGALAGNGEHRAGYTPGQPCSENCASSDEQKQNQPNCQGSDCGSNSNLPKCTSGVCDTNASPSSESYGLAPGQHSGPNQNIQPHSDETPDGDDRPGKIDISSFHEHNNTPPGHVILPENGSPQYRQPCTSPACGPSHPVDSTSCNTQGCDNSPQSGNKLCTSPARCDQSAPSGVPSTSTNSGAPANTGAGTYGHSPQFSPGYTRTPIVNQKPEYPSSSSDSKSSQYGGSFGGPPGILKPNDYTVPDKSGYSPQHGSPSYGVALSGTPSGPHGGAPSQPAIHDQPPHLHSPSFPSASAGSTPLISYVPPNKGQKPSSSQYGNSVSPNFTGSGAFAGAAAGAQAAAYTGGFGGPPGILKPNDFGLHGVKPPGFAGPHSDKGPIGLPHHSGTSPNQGKHPTAGAVQDNTPYQGGFGGPPGVIRPSGPIGTGTFPSTQPQSKPEYNVPVKPISGCGPGLVCSGAYPGEQPDGKPQHISPEKPSNVYPGPEAGQYDSPYQGGFGGAPGVVRPNGPIGTGTFRSTKPQSKPEFNVPGKPTSGCGPGSACSGPYPGEQPDGKPQHIYPGKPSSVYPGPGAGGGNSPDQGGFGGVPGAIRPSGPIETGVLPSAQSQDKLEHISPGKPVFECDPNSGSVCSYLYPGKQPESRPHGQTPQHSREPAAGCGPGSECNRDSPYLGTFGGAPGVIRPSDSTGAGAFPAHNLAKPESSHPQQSYLENLAPIYPSRGNTPIAPSSGSPASSAGGSGSFAGAAAGATAGAVGGHGGHIGQGHGGAPSAGSPAGVGVPGSLAFAGASAGAAAGTFGGHSGHAGQAGYGGLGTFGASGGYGGYPKNGGFIKSCGGGCAGDGGVKGGNEVNSYGVDGGLNGGFGLNLGGALAAAKSVVGSFGLLGPGAGAGAGAGAGSAGGSFGLGGSFASAQASAGAKSYGGYH